MSLRSNTFYTTIKEKQKLNQNSSHKCTFHLSLDLKEAQISYRPGDCIGIYPKNSAQLVDKTLEKMGFTGDEVIEHRKYGSLSLKELLSSKVNITKVTKPVLKAIAKAQTDLIKKEALEEVLSPEGREKFHQLSEETELWDLIEDQGNIELSLEEWARVLPPLMPRLYSICSSQKVAEDEVHLLIALTSYESLGQKRQGVCTNYLYDLDLGDQILCYLQKTADFLLPEDQDIPIIMIGPGTGLAPFRAFMQERHVISPQAKSWLFFGECYQASDFYYENEWNELCKTDAFKITTAFSRDQKDKIYVQDRLRENGSELYSWIEKGAMIYLCGDAKHMAPSVDQALVDIFEKEGHASPQEFLEELKKEKRYLRDVY